ncbi:MAG: hypothetical protein AB7F66_00390 [Bacteriovoracia bacterium]
MADATWKELEKDPWMANLIDILKGEYGDPLPEEVKEWLLDCNRWSEVVPTQALKWIEDLGRVTGLILSKQAGVSDFVCFWIRLDGVFEELQPYFSPRSGVSIPDMQHCYDAILAMRGLLSEDELLWVEHERHCNVHPIPQYHRKDIHKTKGGEIKLKNQYKQINLDDLNARLKKVIAPYGGLSNHLAFAIATRITDHVDKLVIGARHWRSAY